MSRHRSTVEASRANTVLSRSRPKSSLAYIGLAMRINACATSA